jgi:ERCC4-type nuclease
MKGEPPILIDSREQTPWSFPCETLRGTLHEGDYTLIGTDRYIAIERKSLGDLVQTVIQGWVRFRKELNRLSGYDIAVIAVEANIGDVLAHKYESDANPLSVIGRCHDCLIDHGVPVLFWGPKAEAEVTAYRLLRLAWGRYGS